ncbi:uncharacterized protein LOC117180051 [Belonocnema kinseyi]|uniref:uncharacterized protein LOC117180051 n=1 Tax=Belonocnema kinseyi TaxID=2817044 RepID=UPI00143D68E5|nr:uncharacterized protein LOC117180051 [Belonocnema kinseyi]
MIQFTIKGGQPILGVTEQAKVILNYTTMLVNVLVTMFTRERFVEVWSMIQDFDYDTNELGFPQMENGIKLRVWGILLLNVLIWFSGIVFIIGLRFKHLNKIVSFCSPNETGFQRKPQIDSKVVEKFYGDLITASRKLNSIYSWSLLLWLFNVSSHTVSNTYFIITAFMDHDFEMLIQLCLAGWFLAYVTQLIVLHVACDFACSQFFFRPTAWAIFY